MELDAALHAYLAMRDAEGVRTVDALSVEQARSMIELEAPKVFGPVEPVASVHDRGIPGSGGPIPVRVYHPSPGAILPILVYFHGGGWVHGSLDTHDGVCRALAQRTPCVVVAVDYRLAPEHPFPAAVEDAWAAVSWVAARGQEVGGDPTRIAVGGDSAGGNLSAVVAIMARDRRAPVLALQLLVYPAVDYSLRTRSFETYATGYVLTRAMMRWYWRNYVPIVGQRRDRRASPLRTRDLSGVAPAAVLSCEYDPLRDQQQAYADRLDAAGVPVTYRCYEGLSHGVYRMPRTVPRAWELINDSVLALRAALGAEVRDGRPTESI